MSKPRQPIEALIVQYFTEQPLAACESVKRIVDDIMRHRRSRPEPGVNPVERRRRRGNRPLKDALTMADSATPNNDEDDAAF